METQMALFVGQADAPVRSTRRAGRSERIARRLDHMAAAADLRAEQSRAAGDRVGERAAREDARDARRSAQILRAGPSGVARLIAA